ncbi:MAG: DUF1223 domain-containing protein, partial [bacterium]
MSIGALHRRWRDARAMLATTLSLALTLSLSSVATHAQDAESIEPPTQIEIASADFRVPLVELYTSEGCSSCPPADRWLSRLGAALGDELAAVPLAFHVDYWNYLGWSDPYAQASFTKRQRAAAANNRQHTIYTPAFLVDGRGARRGDDMLRTIRGANAQAAQADIGARITRRGADRIAAQIKVEVDSRAAHRRARAYIAVYESGITREIGGGENRGRTLRHDFVVRHWSRPIAIAAGTTDAEIEVEIPQDWNRPGLG